MNALDVVEGLLDIVLKLVPKETAQVLLDRAAIRRANAIADLVEDARGLK